MSGVLLLGCGYTGRRVAARLLARGITVIGAVREAASLESLVLHEGRLLGQGEPEAILGDEALLRTARLRMPGALAMARALRGTGVLAEDPRGLSRDILGLCRALLGDPVSPRTRGLVSGLFPSREG